MHLGVHLFLSFSDMILHQFGLLLGFNHTLVIDSKSLQFLDIGLYLSFLCGHLRHLPVELLHGLFHLAALLKQVVFPLDQLVSLAIDVL